MKITSVSLNDLGEIKNLQPGDWNDIIPDVTFYINSSFCQVIKASIDSVIAGIGAVIYYGNTAWLAHIIVGEQFRNKGIGSSIVKYLIERIDNKKYPSVLLFATNLGEPIYVKVGFQLIYEYMILKRENNVNNEYNSSLLISYQDYHKRAILDMDKDITGEDRSNILSCEIETTKLFLENKQAIGFYIPGLREGPIIAKNHQAGLELMKFKYSTANKAVLPVENKKGIEYLLNIGFNESSVIKRMLLGKVIVNKPEKIYSRIGGNFG